MFGKAAQIGGYALFAVMLAAMAVLFYFGGFTYLLSDQSSSFSVELALTQIRAHPDASVLVLGNSTAAEDFRSNDFNARFPRRTALNLGVPSGHLYLYDRILATSVQAGLRPRTIILIVTPELFSLRTDFDYLLNDLTMLKTILDSTDLVRLAGHTRNPREYVNYASYVVARPVLFRGELRDFFVHPRGRIEQAAVVRHWLASFGPRSPATESDNAFSVCEVKSLPGLPAAIEQLRREGRASAAAAYQRVLAGYAARVHQPLRVDEFEMVRFRRLLDRFAALKASVYIVAAPYYDPNYDQYPPEYRKNMDRAVRQVVSGVPGVTLLAGFPADCGMFFDTVHLNRKGAEQFTQYLYSRVI